MSSVPVTGDVLQDFFPKQVRPAGLEGRAELNGKAGIVVRCCIALYCMVLHGIVFYLATRCYPHARLARRQGGDCSQVLHCIILYGVSLHCISLCCVRPRAATHTHTHIA